MKTNIGSMDNIIRMVLGLVILAIGIKAHAWWKLFGLVPLITAIVGHRQIYSMLGIDGDKIKETASNYAPEFMKA